MVATVAWGARVMASVMWHGPWWFDVGDNELVEEWGGQCVEGPVKSSCAVRTATVAGLGRWLW